MEILEIRKFNDKILSQKAKRIGKTDQEIKDLAENMAETMRLNQGIGLAAPQVGVLKKLIVVESDFKNQRVLALVNPKIIKKSKEKTIDREGCLSFPGIYLDIKRSKEITVKAKNIEGKKLIIKAEGLIARVLQHEIDHLKGVVFYKRLNPIKRIIFRAKRKF